MSSEKKYVLIAAGIILACAIGIGLIIGLETGDGWRGVEVTIIGIGIAVVVMALLWLVGRASGNH